MSEYSGAGIFSQARRANAEEPGVVSQFVNARIAESAARQAEQAPAPTTKIPSLVAAVMRGNAQIQSDGRTKEFKQKLDQTLARVKITEHGDGTVDIKGAPAEFFNGQSMAAEGKANAEEPMKKVDQALGTGAAAPQPPAVDPVAMAHPEKVNALETMYVANDESFGRRLPRPYEVDEMLKTPEGVRSLTLLLGGTERDARNNIKDVGRGNNRELFRNNLTKRLVALHSQLYETNKPAMTDSEQASRASLEGVKETRRVVNSFLDNRVEGYASADDAVATVKQHVIDSGLPWTDAIEKETRNEYAAKRSTVDAAKSRTIYEHIRGMKDEEIRGYGGDPARWISDTEGSLGVKFNAEQRGQAEAKFKGIAQEVQDAARKVEADRMKTASRESLQVIQEARRTAAEERRISLDERRLRKDDSAESRTRRKEQDARVDAAESDLRNIDKELRAINMAFAKLPADATEDARDEMKRQAALLVSRIPEAQNKLHDALGVTSQEEWDALIAAGHTPQEISASGVRAVRKRKR